MTQLALWPVLRHHCAQCTAETAALIAQFWQAVDAGTYDRDGYTPAERKAQQKRARAA